MSTHLRILSAVVFSLAVGLGGCTANIGDMGDGQGDAPVSGNNPDNLSPDEVAELCEGDGQAGSTCEVAADCQAPMVCLNGTCVGPRNPDVSCDPIEGQGCPNADEVCVANVCVKNPGSCEVHDDCPLGYICSSGQCQPERDGNACPDPGPGPNLTGTYAMTSVLHLREGLPGVVDGILDASEVARDIVNGTIDLNLGTVGNFIAGAVVSSIVRAYVPPWGIDLVNALGDLSDMLDTMQVEGTMKVQGQPCDGTYRVKETWNWISFEFRGQQLRFSPDNLPGVPGGSTLEPDEYQAFYSCGVLYFDRHRVQDTMSGLIRFLVDTVAQASTGYNSVEQALSNIVDCNSVGYEVDYQVSQVCSFCGAVGGIAASACQGFVNEAATKVGQAIDDAAVNMSLIKLKGTIAVGQDGSLSDGTWYGSIVGGDFPGELTMQKN